MPQELHTLFSTRFPSTEPHPVGKWTAQEVTHHVWGAEPQGFLTLGQAVLVSSPLSTGKKTFPMCPCFLVSESGESLPSLRSSSKLVSAFY